MLGIALGILAAFIWSLSNLTDKYLVDEFTDDGNIGGVLIFSCFFSFILIPIGALLASNNVLHMSWLEIGTLMTSGVLMAIIILFYLKAMAADDASVVMTLLVLAPFFSLVFAQFILHETLTGYQILAGSLLVVGSLVVAFDHKTTDFKWKLVGFAVAASALIGLMNSLFKFAAVEAGVWESMFWRSVGAVLAGVMLFIFVERYRQDFHLFLKRHFKQASALNVTNEVLTLSGDTVFAFAMLSAPLAILQTMEAYQPIFIFIIIALLNLFGYKVITEDFSKQALFQKGIGFSFVITGTVLLSVFA